MDRFALASQAVIYVVDKSEQPAWRNLIDAKSYDEVFWDNHPGTDKSRVPIDSFNFYLLKYIIPIIRTLYT